MGLTEECGHTDLQIKNSGQDGKHNEQNVLPEIRKMTEILFVKELELFFHREIPIPIVCKFNGNWLRK
jgi:hypothetical protein